MLTGGSRMLKATLLGTGGMMPLKDRALTSLIVTWNGHSILIDCGEGTQVQIRSAGYSFKSIDMLLLTHYHADHTNGLTEVLTRLPVDTLYLPDIEDEYGVRDRLVSLAERRV